MPMDKSAQKLLQELRTIGNRPPELKSTPKPKHEDGKLDRWRILLVELIYLIHTAFEINSTGKDAKGYKDTFRQLSRILDELDQMTIHDGFVYISHRGNGGLGLAKPASYMIQFGQIIVDRATVVSLISRMGIRLKHLEGRLKTSFQTLADQGFKKLTVKLPGESPEAMAALHVSLEAICGFKTAVEQKSAIVITQSNNPYSVLPVCNEHHLPDPNLTMLAAVNDLDQNAMTKLCDQAIAKTGSSQTPITIFESIFKIKSLRQRLTRPPLEVHVDPVFWPQAKINEAASDGHHQKKPAQSKADPSALKDGVARFVKGKFGKSPQTASQIMQSIYGMDYRRINSQGLGRRLTLVTDLLNSMQKTPSNHNVTSEVLRRIQARMDQVPDEILEDFVVKKEELKFWSEGAEKTVSRIDKGLLKIIDESKSRSGARRQSRIRLAPEKDYIESDFAKIASDFSISPKDTADIIRLFKSCFDSQGNFLRAAFENKVPKFAVYKKKVFEILWEFLKETSRRSNRLPLLYSIQLLIRETRQPIQAIKLLLAHFIQDPANVVYADRNAIMLVNQFLRSYIKDSDMDIEMTPEEVLRVKGGLDANAVNYGVWKIDAEQQAVLEKMISVRKKLIETLAPDLATGPLLPARFLIALEREIHIFLALVGGKIPYEVLRNALNVYGNPASQIYHLKESTRHLEPLLLHLAVIIRGFARLADQSDFPLLAEVKIRQDQFRALHDDLRYHALVRHVMNLIDELKDSVEAGPVKSK